MLDCSKFAERSSAEPDTSSLDSRIPVPIQTNPFYTSHPVLSRSIWTLPSHLRLGLPRGPFPSGFLNKYLYVFNVSLLRATWPSHNINVTFGVQQQTRRSPLFSKTNQTPRQVLLTQILVGTLIPNTGWYTHTEFLTNLSIHSKSFTLRVCKYRQTDRQN